MTSVDVIHWSPPEWSRNCFPLPNVECEILDTEQVISTLSNLVDSITEADTTALGAVLHVAHILKTMQGDDGAWPATFNARTGDCVGVERSFAPAPLFFRLNRILSSSEFEESYNRSVAGGFNKFVES